MTPQPTNIDPAAAFQALQQYVSTEIARLYGEIAARDAYISQLHDQLNGHDAVQAEAPIDSDS